jgi:hypothetical protein
MSYNINGVSYIEYKPEEKYRGKALSEIAREKLGNPDLFKKIKRLKSSYPNFSYEDILPPYHWEMNWTLLLPPAAPPTNPTEYITRPNDTIWKVAAAHSVSVVDLIKSNPDLLLRMAQHSDIPLPAGEKLILPRK